MGGGHYEHCLWIIPTTELKDNAYVVAVQEVHILVKLDGPVVDEVKHVGIIKDSTPIRLFDACPLLKYPLKGTAAQKITGKSLQVVHLDLLDTQDVWTEVGDFLEYPGLPMGPSEMFLRNALVQLSMGFEEVLSKDVVGHQSEGRLICENSGNEIRK